MMSEYGTDGLHWTWTSDGPKQDCSYGMLSSVYSLPRSTTCHDSTYMEGAILRVRQYITRQRVDIHFYVGVSAEFSCMYLEYDSMHAYDPPCCSAAAETEKLEVVEE